jgi:hypothetical protein
MLTSLPFAILSITLFILLSYSLLSSTILQITGRTTEAVITPLASAAQYIGLAIEAIVLGSSCVGRSKVEPHNPEFIRGYTNVCPSVYVAAGLFPLLMNLALYYLQFRGRDYVEIHRAALGSGKYILFFTFLTHSAFIRLFSSWATLDTKVKHATVIIASLFVYIYIELMPLRTGLFMFAMYAFYFFGGRILLWKKISAVLIILLLFSWMAIHRGNSDDFLKDKGIAVATVDAMSFGLLMIRMVPWSFEQLAREGPAWGATSFWDLTHSEKAPGVRYVREIAPEYADAGGGFGFFYVAELLLNFGYLGGLCVAFVLGVMMQMLSTSVHRWTACTAAPAFLAVSFPLTRNDITMTLKIPIYLMIGCMVLDVIATHCHYLGRLNYRTQRCLCDGRDPR